MVKLALSYLRIILSFFGFLAVSFGVPIAVTVYFPGWHEASCNWHPRCSQYGRDLALIRIAELRAFLQHRGELPQRWWTLKERTHLAEVRSLLDRAAFAVLFAIALLFQLRLPRRVAMATFVTIAASALVLPFFSSFWREVFHPLLFQNHFWQNLPEDTSWWIMPRLYFYYTTNLVIISAAVISGLGIVFCNFSFFSTVTKYDSTLPLE